MSHQTRRAIAHSPSPYTQPLNSLFAYHLKVGATQASDAGAYGAGFGGGC